MLTFGQRIIVGLVSLALVHSVAGQTNERHTSYIGGFEVELPSGLNGFSGMGSGFRLTWSRPEAEYEIGFHEVQGLPLAQVDGKFSYDEAVRRYFNRFSASGEQVYRRDATLQTHEGYEYKYRTRESVFFLRLFLVGDRVYQVQAKVPIAQESTESRVFRVFDSVKLIDKDVVAKHFAKQIADATPAAPPQSPKVRKARPDLHDRNLKGLVKSVMTESAGYALNNSMKQKHPTKYEEFDADGWLTKEIEYDSYGAPLKVAVYGFVAGKRVARIGSIEQESVLHSMSIAFPGMSKFDRRFQEYYTYLYVGGNLAEERYFWSNGALFGRTTHRYSKNTKVTEYFDGGRRAFRRVVAELDENRNEIKLTPFEPEGRRYIEQAPYDIAYDSYDSHGNWTQRSTSRWYGIDGRGKRFPESVTYRTITYHQ